MYTRSQKIIDADASSREIRNTTMQLTDDLISRGGLNQTTVFESHSSITTSKFIPIIISILDDLRIEVIKRQFPHLGTSNFIGVMLYKFNKIYDHFSMPLADRFLHLHNHPMLFDFDNFVQHFHFASFVFEKAELHLLQELLMWLQIMYLTTLHQVQAKKKLHFNDDEMIITIDREDEEHYSISGITKFAIATLYKKMAIAIDQRLIALEMRSNFTVLFQAKRQNHPFFSLLPTELLIECATRATDRTTLSTQQSFNLVNFFLTKLIALLEIERLNRNRPSYYCICIQLSSIPAFSFRIPDIEQPFDFAYVDELLQKWTDNEDMIDSMKEYVVVIKETIEDNYLDMMPSSPTLFKPQMDNKIKVILDAIQTKQTVREIFTELDALWQIVKEKRINRLNHLVCGLLEGVNSILISTSKPEHHY